MYRVYGYDGCPYCKKAVDLLQSELLEYHYVPITEKEARTMFLDQRGFKDPHRTFPRVYELVGGEEVLVGGYAQLETKILLG